MSWSPWYTLEEVVAATDVEPFFLGMLQAEPTALSVLQREDKAQCGGVTYPPYHWRFLDVGDIRTPEGKKQLNDLIRATHTIAILKYPLCG